jgi:hypothetical protein
LVKQHSGEKSDMANHEVVTLALHLLGGDAHRVDTEDLAVKANELAPGRFTWVKYHDQINIGNVRWALWDAKKPENGAYVTGSEKKGWLLTEAGLKFARPRLELLNTKNLSRPSQTPKERLRLRNERARLISSSAYEKYQRGQSHDITPQEAEAFFRIDDYITGEVRKQKLIRTLNIFGEDPELGEAARELAKLVRVR